MNRRNFLKQTLYAAALSTGLAATRLAIASPKKPPCYQTHANTGWDEQLRLWGKSLQEQYAQNGVSVIITFPEPVTLKCDDFGIFSENKTTHHISYVEPDDAPAFSGLNLQYTTDGINYSDVPSDCVG